MPILNRIADWQDELTGWRRHLHAHPELDFEVHDTAAFVALRLREMGVDEVHTGIGRTGVVGVLRGRAEGRAIGLRADMDALPIHEESGVPHASTVKGLMHACGHDGHTTMLLGAARYLAETRNFAGTAYLIFQPAEEGGGGGRVMVEDGLFDRFPAEQVFGLHNWPGLAPGTFAMCEGPCMAAADRFDIVLEGRGAHAAMPHQGRDPITAAASLVQGLQTLVSRETDPIDHAVLSVTKVAAGDTHNVVPERAVLMGTVRTFKDEVQDRIERRMRAMVDGIAMAHGLDGRLDYQRSYPATVNAVREAGLGADAAAELVGEDKVIRGAPPSMGAEDFSFMLKERPGSYIWMGVGGADEGRTLHSAKYDFNDEALPFGVSYWVRLTERLLPAS